MDLFMLVTTDHVFGDGALAALARTGRPAVLVDQAPDAEAWTERTRVLLHEERAVAFSKELEHPSIDCGAFLLPLGVFDRQRRAASRGDGSLAGAVTELARSHPLAAVPLPRGAWWHDVDTPKDLRRVSRTVRRSLAKEADGPVSRYLKRRSRRGSRWRSRVRARRHRRRDRQAPGAGEPGSALFDGVLDRIADAAVIAGLAVWSSNPAERRRRSFCSPSPPLPARSCRWRPRTGWRRFGPARAGAQDRLPGGRDARLLLVSIGALLGQPEIAPAVVAITSGLSLAARLLLTRAALRA